MRQAKAFLVVCLGILALALAYHFGATTATAQAPGNPIVAADGGYVYTVNGDCYESRLNVGGRWDYRGNVFGGPVPAQSISVGQLKAKYAK
jgi:hypothetical protein